MSRRKAHWPYRISPTMELESAKRWLGDGLKQDRGGSRLPPDIYRTLAIVEAITIIDNLLDQFRLEAKIASDERQRLYELERKTQQDTIMIV